LTFNFFVVTTRSCFIKMPPRSDEEKARRKLLHQQKLEARKLKKAKEEKEKQEKAALSQQHNQNDIYSDDLKGNRNQSAKQCYLFDIPQDASHQMMKYLAAKDLGALSMTCRRVNFGLVEARSHHLFSRLQADYTKNTEDIGRLRVPMKLCESQSQVEELISIALEGSGDTGRIVTKKGKKGDGADEYIAYARFIEEAVLGRSAQKFHGQKTSFLPPVINGRFASASPEHSLCRAGGGDKSGAGGSGTASWGVGKRGQLGHGNRKDESKPRLLLGGIGYGIRIVQVSAGGGLARVAHSLLLTSTGQVLSFGCAQYGQLGHGYSAGKQLPDTVRPQYIEELSHLHCTCVSAGELHSAVVSSDGDLYTWGDGFCGQLGLGDKRPQLTPKQVTKGELEDECILSVNCGARHTLCVTEDGDVFSFGLGHFGVLGRSFTPYEYHSPQALSNMGAEVENEAAPHQLPRIEGITDVMRNHIDLLANLTLDDNSDQCIPKLIDALQGITIVGVSAGHRHSMFLDAQGGVYTCGSGHGPSEKQDVPMRVMNFVDSNVKIMQLSAGVDISMAVSTTGDAYAWGRTTGGRIGLETDKEMISIPQKVSLKDSLGRNVKAIDVECGYVHSMIIGCDGSLYMCGGVGTDGHNDGLQEEVSAGQLSGEPIQIEDFNIWHRLKEPHETKKKVQWKKYGKYELKGRSAMKAAQEKWNV